MNDKVDKKLNDIMGIESTIKKETAEVIKQVPASTDNVDTDYRYARENLYNLVERGTDAIGGILEIARESEHPRAFEVLSGMIKNISDVNDRLMDLNKKKKDIDKKEEIKKIANTTNNLFVGSTADLQKILKNEKELIDVTPKQE